jgi:RNA recognition motif-containing protein
MNIFVAKLSQRTNDTSLHDLFQEYGEVSSAKVIFDRETGNSKGYGFVEMPDETEALQAIENLNDSEFEGNNIVVKKARPKEGNQGRGGGEYRSHRR